VLIDINSIRERNIHIVLPHKDRRSRLITLVCFSFISIFVNKQVRKGKISDLDIIHI